MPDKPTWTLRIPEALQDIEAQPDKALWFPVDVEALLDVKRRRAQEIISAAGPEQVGRAQAVTRESLVLYLRVQGGSELEAMERRRRREFAQKLKGMERAFVETPRLMVEPKPEVLRPVFKKGLEGLPEGIVLEPGRITVSFEDGEEALQKLFYLATAIGRSGVDVFEEMVSLKKRSA